MDVEQDVFECGGCGLPVVTYWVVNGLIPGDYVLAGDLVFHPKCWDDRVDLYLEPNEEAYEKNTSLLHKCNDCANVSEELTQTQEPS